MFFKKLKPYIRDYFTLTSRERKGALVLACIILFQIATLIWLHYLPSNNTVEISKHSMELEAFDKKMNDQNKNSYLPSGQISEHNISKKSKPVLRLCPVLRFLLKLGCSSKAESSLLVLKYFRRVHISIISRLARMP